jgi:2',3'-cyclic-nucleotide 2'-phosphodiesterase/3'-nucleotidase
MVNENDHLLLFEKNDEGKLVWSERSNSPMLLNRYYNFDTAEGIEYIVDISKPVGERVTIKQFSDGKEFGLNKTYKAAVNSYRGNGGGGHLTKGAGIPQDELAGRIVNSTEKDLRFYLMKWIEQEKVVQPNCTNNWDVIPSEWYLKAKETDSKILLEGN